MRLTKQSPPSFEQSLYASCPGLRRFEERVFNHLNEMITLTGPMMGQDEWFDLLWNRVRGLGLDRHLPADQLRAWMVQYIFHTVQMGPKGKPSERKPGPSPEQVDPIIVNATQGVLGYDKAQQVLPVAAAGSAFIKKLTDSWEERARRDSDKEEKGRIVGSRDKLHQLAMDYERQSGGEYKRDDDPLFMPLDAFRKRYGQPVQPHAPAAQPAENPLVAQLKAATEKGDWGTVARLAAQLQGKM